LRRVLIFLTVILTLVYPLTIWFAEGAVEPRVLAGLLLLAGLSRLASGHFGHAARWWVGGTMLLVLLAAWANVMLPLKLYPVVVNAALLGVFAYSLVVPPSAIERIARMREPQLPPRAIAYTRRVTQIWCGFFTVNGAIALYTALYASSAHWSLYNGFIAYILIGLLFAGEYCVRRYVMEQLRG
jgi:uncharacterized membrane protein